MYALTQYNQQPSAFPVQPQGRPGGDQPSPEDLSAAVRLGMGFGLGMTIAPQQTGGNWGMTPEAETFAP